MSIVQGVFLKRQLIALCLIAAVGIAFADGSGNPQAEAQDLHRHLATAVLPAEHEPSRAEQVTRALVQAYPGRVLRAEFRNGDWAVLLRGNWFYYSEGRFLPSELRGRASQYRPIAFYNNYPRELPPWTPPTPEQVNRFRGVGATRAAQLPRATYFFDALYQASNRDQAYRQMQTISFLGRRIPVHNAIVRELAMVESRIMAAAETDPAVRQWVQGIGRMYGWNWRNVGGTQSRSFHAYGVAVDIIPRDLGGRAMYWRWVGAGWYNIPHEGRYHPPDVVIRAFQELGFVWGGKWSFFDTMHFEFRPEVMILNGLDLITLQ